MIPKVIIVNESDEIIGYKERWTIKTEDIYRVSALSIKNNKWDFLLAQRSFDKKNNPWEWSISAAWTIEEGESYDENISHEIEEELWITLSEYKKIDNIRVIWKHNFFCQFYTAILDENLNYFTIQKEEVEDIRWFSLEEIKLWEFKWNPISKTLINNLELFI